MSDRLKYHLRRLRDQWRTRISEAMEVTDFSPVFKGKEVVVVGPNCRMDDQDVQRIRQADVTVVMNKGIHKPIYGELRRNARKLAYFHCLVTDEFVGGGKLDTIELRSLGISKVFYALNEPALARTVQAFHKNNRGLARLYRIDPTDYAYVVASLAGFRPTTGLVVTSTLARTEGCKLYVTGLSFYRTPYSRDYSSHLTDLESIRRQLEASAIHHPDREYLEFIRLRREHDIDVDRQLSAILEVPYRPLFYTDAGDARLVPEVKEPQMA